MAPPSDAPAMPQRQSCDRCHKQKLRCTNKNSNNGSVCDRCFRKRAQCIYSSSLPKGRPKRTGTSGGNQSSSSTSSMAVSLASPSPSALATKQDAFGAGVPPTAQTPSPGGTTNLTLGDDLAQMFDECFVRRNSSRLDIYQDSIMSFQLRAEQSSSSVPSGQSSTYSRLSHESVLSFLMLDMVEMLLRICSDLECRESYIAHDRNYSASLFADCTPTMFDTQSEHDPEVPELPERHCIIQLIDMWFSVHPFSPIISKSLLIAQFDDGTIDEALLAIILAGTAQTYQNTILPDNGGTDSAEVLARLAATQLRDRLLSSVDPGSFSISTIQTMVLLAWRDFCVGRIRRAVCLAAYTCRIIQRLNASPRKEGRDNREILGGVAIHMVENEILQNIGWLCLATSTWAFIQIDQPFPLLSPEQLPDLPCLDEAKSAMFRLDRATNNISTLPAQVQAMQRLFPLSYITSTVAHIYTFYLNAPVNYGTTTEASSWQTRHIQRLHRLRVASYDPSMLSSEIRAILSATILAVETEVTYIPSQCLLSLTYHTISMHTLFPRKQTDATTQSYQIPFSVLNAFCEEVSAIVAISRRLLSFTSSPMSAQNLGLANSAGMLALSLDSCSKALVHIYCDFEHRPSSEREGTLDISKRFANYAGELHQISQEVVTLHIGSAARLSKKRLKRMKLAFQSFGSSPGSRSTESYLSGEANDHSIFSNHHDQSEIDILLDSQFGITNPSAMQFDQSISGSQEDIMPFDPASMLQNFDISMMRSLLDTPNNYQGM